MSKQDIRSHQLWVVRLVGDYGKVTVPHSHSAQCRLGNLAAPLQRGEKNEFRASPLQAVRSPSFFKKNMAGHPLVIPDWNRFNPTKAVNRYQ